MELLAVVWAPGDRNGCKYSPVDRYLRFWVKVSNWNTWEGQCHDGVQAQFVILQATAGCSIVVLIAHNLQKIKKSNSKAWIQPSGVHRHLLLAWDCSRNRLLLPLRRPINRREAVWNSVKGLGNMQNLDEHIMFCFRRLPGCFLATRSVKSVSSSLSPSSARSTGAPSGPRWRWCALRSVSFSVRALFLQRWQNTHVQQDLRCVRGKPDFEIAFHFGSK